ncbi:MAG: hypothetical protein AAF629_32235 [Chloroflexota bacterium]
MSEKSIKWRFVYAAIIFIGAAIFLAGIFFFPARPVVFIGGMILIAFGLNLSIASAYKARTGKDHLGTQFWKRVFGIKN